MNNYRSDFNSNNSPKIEIKTRQQIAEEYGWKSVQTLRTKLRQYEIELPNGSITPKWQKIIYDCLGYPSGISKSTYKEV